MKEKILDAFKNLGFEMEDLEELGYGFEYEGIHYLWMANNDEDFLNIAVPAIFDMADTNELEFYQVMDKLNSTLKFIKVNELGNSMWMFYERELFGGEDFEQLLPRIFFIWNMPSTSCETCVVVIMKNPMKLLLNCWMSQ